MATTLEMRAILKDEITAGLKGIEAELKKVSAEGRAAGTGMSTGMSSTLPSVRSVTDALGAQVAQLRSQAAAMKTAEYQKYAAEQKKIRAEIEAMTTPQKKAESGWMNISNAVKGFMALQVVGYIKDAGLAIYEATAEMDSLRRGLTAVMGSSAKAAAEMERLREVAKLPGLGYAEAIRMSTSLQASGMSARMARDAMMAFGNALATVGKGKTELDGVGLALSQIMAKGKVSAEEINQIAERVPQIRVAMQAAFGTANTEMIQSMGLTSKEFIAGITGELGKMERVTGGLRTGTENLSDAWFEFKANLGGTGSAFSAVANAASTALQAINDGYKEMKKNNDARQIETAMKTMAWIRRVEAEELAKGRRLTQAEKAEIEKRLDAQRKILAAYKKPAEADPEVEKVKMVREAIARETKATRKSELEGAKLLYTNRLAMTKSDATARAEVEVWYRNRLAEINAEWDKKEKKPKAQDLTVRTSHVTLSEDPETRRRRLEAYENENRAIALNAKAENDAAKEKRDNWKELVKLAGEGRTEQIKGERDYAKEQRERSQKEREEFEADLATRLNMHNGVLTSMIKGETDFTDGMRQMWDDTGTAIISKLLEIAATWIAEQAAMLVFSTAAKATETATTVAAGSAMTAAMAPAAASASVASFGGAAGAGAGALAVAVPSMLALFSTARATGGSAMGEYMRINELGMEGFKPTRPGQIINHHNTTNQGATITINVASMSAADIARIQRQGVRTRAQGAR